MRGASPHFTETVETEVELREIMGEPGGLALGKQRDRLDHHCRDFVALSPFVLVGTSDAEGACDVSPAAMSRGSCSRWTRRRSSSPNVLATAGSTRS